RILGVANKLFEWNDRSSIDRIDQLIWEPRRFRRALCSWLFKSRNRLVLWRHSLPGCISFGGIVFDIVAESYEENLICIVHLSSPQRLCVLCVSALERSLQGLKHF